jgi:hypothetical protein
MNRLIALVVVLSPVEVFADDADFAARCAAPGVVRCVGFDSAAEAPINPTEYTNQPAPIGVYDDGDVTPELDTVLKASGASSLKFTIPGNSGSAAGSAFYNFSDDFSVQFGQGSAHGDEFYIQWRQRFSTAFLETVVYEDWAAQDRAGGWKQVIIGEGDRADQNIASCTDLEIVVNDGSQRRFPQMYHSCGAKDGRYEGLQEPYGSYDFLLQNAIRTEPDICSYHYPNVPPCFGYVADQWMTFQVHVKIGTPYDNDGVYLHDSWIQLWVAEEDQPATLVIDYSPHDPTCAAQQTSQPSCQTGYDLYNDNPTVRHYGQIWLLPYHTRKDPAQPHDTGYTWYDELIISTQRIPDPNTPPDTTAPAAPTSLSVQ